MADIKTVQLIVNSEQAKSKLDDINNFLSYFPLPLKQRK